MFQTMECKFSGLRRKLWLQIYTSELLLFVIPHLLEYGNYKAFEERIYASSKLKNDPSPKEVLRTVT